jgi:tetratricopeptide (TPR) repeat protein
VHEHLSDVELARYAMDPESVPAERRQVIEQEAARCPICRTSLDFFSVVTLDDLADLELSELEPAWRDEDDRMRAYVERIAAEDEEADELLAQQRLLTSPTKAAWKNFQRDKRLLTGGVVRRLNAHANSIYQDHALEALTFADAAISVAETLADDIYPWKAVQELRGTAWKERANALLVLGEYRAALDALMHAERAYRMLRSPAFGLATVALVRASVLYEQGRLDEATALAERAERGFAHIGQEERCTRALFLRASINYEAGNIARAMELFREVVERSENVRDVEWIGRASYAMGNCEVERRNLSEAAMYFHRALVIFREIGPDRERLKTEWGLARIVLYGGNRTEAISRLRTVASELEKQSLFSDAALVRLDMVDAMLLLGQSDQIIELCGRLFHVFRNAGMITGALTAIAYMKEAAASGKLTTAGVDAVRSYLRRVERQPHAMFDPPPDAFR